MFTAGLNAAPITGTLSGGGSAEVSNTFLNFLCDVLSTAPCADAGQGSFLVGPVSATTQTGSFASVANTWATLKDLNNVTEPVGSSFMLPDFIVFQANPALHLDLTFINPGSFPAGMCFSAPSPGQICTPPLPTGVSAFNLINGANNQSTATFQVQGTGYSVSASTGTSTYVGTFSADFNEPYQTLLAQLASNGGTGSVTAPYSARFTLTPVVPPPGVPEPATSMMVVGGLLVMAGVVRRRKNT